MGKVEITLHVVAVHYIVHPLRPVTDAIAPADGGLPRRGDFAGDPRAVDSGIEPGQRRCQERCRRIKSAVFDSELGDCPFGGRGRATGGDWRRGKWAKDGREHDQRNHRGELNRD